jgi:2-keto-3-deoxy-L-rhamnonate aldolase RhmA
MKRGEIALGLLIRLCHSVQMAKVAKACDHDFLFIDMQHGGMSFEPAINLAHACLDTGVTPLVRVTSTDCLEGARLLDNGALGIVVPDVESAEQARAIVQRCKFPPIGRRSVASGNPQLGYEPMPLSQSTRLLNENTLLVAMIESEKGVENADAIAAVDGIDCLHVGSGDLLTQMGIPDRIGSDQHYALLERVIRAARAHGKIAGVGGARGVEMESRFIQMGARFLTTNSDLAYLMAGASQMAKALRAIKGP